MLLSQFAKPGLAFILRNTFYWLGITPECTRVFTLAEGHPQIMRHQRIRWSVSLIPANSGMRCLQNTESLPCRTMVSERVTTINRYKQPHETKAHPVPPLRYAGITELISFVDDQEVSMFRHKLPDFMDHRFALTDRIDWVHPGFGVMVEPSGKGIPNARQRTPPAHAWPVLSKDFPHWNTVYGVVR